MTLWGMTTAPERRAATLTELVAQEIDSARGRRRMSQAQLARAMGKTPMWVSLRLRGLQPIDLNDLLLFARALDVNVYDLMPPREEAGRAAPGLTGPYPEMTIRLPDHHRPRDNRPNGRPMIEAASVGGRSTYLDRSHRRRRDR